MSAVPGRGNHRGQDRVSAQLLPLLFFLFLVAGLLQSYLTMDVLARWIGPESGLRGNFIGAVTGSLAPGGPYVSMPLAAGFLGSGASIGTMVAFMTGWSLCGVTRMPIEIGIMGWKFVLIRLASTFLFPPSGRYHRPGAVRPQKADVPRIGPRDRNTLVLVGPLCVLLLDFGY